MDNKEAWPTVGAEAVVVTYVNGVPRRPAKRASIVRLTKTQVTLEDGRRFSLNSLRQIGARGRFYAKLIDPADPSARDAEREAKSQTPS